MILDAIRSIVTEAIKALPGATVQMPMPVWDNGAGHMGIQIIQRQERDGVPCTLTAGIVLSKREMESADLCRLKIKTAVAAILCDVTISIVPVRQPRGPRQQSQGPVIEHGGMSH